jgi:pyridoxine kinase
MGESPTHHTVHIGLNAIVSYVGNKMATFVMQALGCDVSALNTVHFSMNTHSFAPTFILYSGVSMRFEYSVCSPRYQWRCTGNHTGYRQVKGTKASAEEIRDIYDGLRQSFLTDFDVLLSGYLPNADAVNAVGYIARDLRFRATNKPGSFFWGRPGQTNSAARVLSSSNSA